MGKHQKGVNPKLHFPPYSLLNKVPAFIQQPNWREKKKKHLNLSSSSSQPVFWQSQNNKWKVRESAWDLVSLLPAKLLLNALWSFRTVLHQSQGFICKTPKSRKERLLAEERVKAPCTQEMNAIFSPPPIFLNYSLLPPLPPPLKQCWRREKS